MDPPNPNKPKPTPPAPPAPPSSFRQIAPNQPRRPSLTPMDASATSVTMHVPQNVPRKGSIISQMSSTESLAGALGKGKGHIVQQVRYNEAFEMTGHGRFNNKALLGGSFIFVHSLMEMIATAYIIIPAECDMDLTINQKALLNLAPYLGIVITSICWGSISDNYGRRKIIMPTLVLAICFSLCSSMCRRFVYMFIFRTLTGCMISATSAIVPVYLGELITSKHRDMYIAISIAASQIGFVLTPGVAYLIIPGKWSFYLGSFHIQPWRVFMWTWSIIGILGMCILITLPESPRYILASRGALKALPILAKMYAMNKKKPASEYPVASIRTQSAVLLCGAEKKSVLQEMLMLLKPPLRRCVMLTHGCMFMTFCLCNGVYLWIPDLINTMLGSMKSVHSICQLMHFHYAHNNSTTTTSATGEKECEEFHALTYPLSMAVEFFCLIPFIGVIYIVEKVPTINKNKIFALIMGWNGVWILVSVMIPHMTISIVCLSAGLAAAACIALLSALVVDAYPISLRGMAMCTMFMCGMFGAMYGNAIMSLMHGAWCYILYIFTALLSLFSGFALVKFWPDIKQMRIEMEAKDYFY